MNKQEFEQYCEAFSTSRDKADVFDRYYDPEAVFEHPFKGTFKGKKAIVDFWTRGHEGIHEVIKPREALFDGDRIAVQVAIEWHCTKDTDYLGPRKKGHVYGAECAAFYGLKNGKITHVKLYLHCRTSTVPWGRACEGDAD